MKFFKLSTEVKRMCQKLYADTSSTLLTALLLIILLVCMGCGRNTKEGKYKLLVGTVPELALMKSYLPEYFSIESFVKPGESAMWFSVNDSNISLLKNADAFIYFNSYLFEHRVSERLKREYPSVKLLPSGQSLPRFMDGFFVGKIQINDPQMFQSIRNSRRAVIESAKRLSESFPEFEKEIMKRAEIREERLHHLDDSLSNALAPLYYSSFVTIHPLLGHFAKDYGLNRYYILPAGRDESINKRQERIDNAKLSSPIALFYDKDFDKFLADSIAKDFGIKPFRVNLDSTDYIGQLIEISRILVDSNQKARLSSPEKIHSNQSRRTEQ